MLAEDPLFVSIVAEILPDYHFPDATAFERHDAFIDAAFAARLGYYKERTSSKEQDLSEIAKFGVCLQALRILSKDSRISLRWLS